MHRGPVSTQSKPTLSAALPSRQNTLYNTAFKELSGDQDFAQYTLQLEQSATEHVRVAASTATAHGYLLARFIAWHENHPWDGWRGREFSQDMLLIRVKACMTGMVASSRAQKDSTKHMKASSLVALRGNMLGIMRAWAHGDVYNHALQKHWEFDIGQYCAYLVVKFGLSQEIESKYNLGEQELKLIFHTAIKNSISLDNTLMHGINWVMTLMSCARPGSLCATQSYPDDFLKWKDVSVKRRDGTPGEFMVDFMILAWKGGHGERRFSQIYRVAAVRRETEYLLDLGMLIVIQGLRRQMFRDYTDLGDLLVGRDSVIVWKEEWLDRPVFCASAPRGYGLLSDQPMMARAGRTVLQKACVAVELGGIGVTGYSMRRSAASTYVSVTGVETAKAMMHHIQGSETIWTNYVNVTQHVDAMAANLYNEKNTIPGESEESNPAAFRRVREEPREPPLTLEQAMVASQELSILNMQRYKLRGYLAGESNEVDIDLVMQGLFEPEREYVATKLKGLGDCDEFYVALYAKISRRANKMFTKMRERYANSHEAYAARRARYPTIDEIQERVQHLKGTDALLSVLRFLSTSGFIDAGDADDSEVINVIEQADSNVQGGDISLTRAAFMRSFINYRDPVVSSQVCRICENEDTRPDEERFHIFKSKSVLDRHILSHHPYIPGSRSQHQAAIDAGVLHLLTSKVHSTAPA